MSMNNFATANDPITTFINGLDITPPVVMFGIALFVMLLIGFVLFVKIWRALGNVKRMTALLEDMHYWARLDYTSKKRRSVITDPDKLETDHALKKRKK